VTAYLVRRVGQAIAVVIGVMIVTFILIHMEPGSAARSILGFRATAARIAIFNSTYGLNEPLWRQFFTYVDQVVHGNLGTSYYYQQPVATLMADRLPNDIVLVGLSTVLALAIAIPLGVYQAVKRGSVTDNLLTGVTFTLYSMPTFFLALLLIGLLCVQVHLFPPVAPQVQTWSGLLGDPRALVLPVVTLALLSVAGYSRYMRSSVIDTLAQEYLTVVRAKGLPERLVIFRHVLRNSMLPIITLVGLSLPAIVSGAIITEDIFNFPGMGQLFFTAAVQHDFPILLASTLLVGVATVVGNLAADVAYGIIDPRVRHAST
jgi:peptide/nickel transport system permease protein